MKRRMKMCTDRRHEAKETADQTIRNEESPENIKTIQKMFLNLLKCPTNISLMF